MSGRRAAVDGPVSLAPGTVPAASRFPRSRHIDSIGRCSLVKGPARYPGRLRRRAGPGAAHRGHGRKGERIEGRGRSVPCRWQVKPCTPTGKAGPLSRPRPRRDCPNLRPAPSYPFSAFRVPRPVVSLPRRDDASPARHTFIQQMHIRSHGLCGSAREENRAASTGG